MEETERHTLLQQTSCIDTQERELERLREKHNHTKSAVLTLSGERVCVFVCVEETETEALPQQKTCIGSFKGEEKKNATAPLSLSKA